MLRRCFSPSNDHMLQALSPNRAHKPFGKGILPRAVRCDRHFLNTHSLHPTTKLLAIDLVSISQQVTWCRILWKGFCHLVPCPQGRRVLCHVEVNDAPAMMSSTTKTNKTRNVAVGTVKKSIETRSW